MSRLRQGNGDDYPDAARKHLEDAKVLLAGSRPDGAAYLAGYVVECALKTVVQLATGRSSHRHDLTGFCDQLDVLAAQASGRWGRTYLAAEASLRASRILNNWTPEQRYRSPGVIVVDATAWCQEADLAYREIIGPLQLAGDL